MKITIKHLDEKNIIILSIFNRVEKKIVNQFQMNGCRTISEGEIMNKEMFYKLYREMQSLGSHDKNIEHLDV